MAVAAYFLLAIASTVDKLLMTGRIPHPVVYAFFVSVLSIIALVLAPFGMQLLPLDGLLISLLSGLFLTGALLFFFTAVNDNDATRVVPFVGGMVPLFTVVLAYFFLGERFDARHFLAFLILVAATVFISVDIDHRSRLKGLRNLIAASVFFAASYFLTKLAFTQFDFLSVFLWARVGSFLGGVALLIPAGYRRILVGYLKIRKPQPKQTPLLFLGGQLAGAGGVILVNYAIALGSVTFVNALQGLQQAFLLGITSIAHRINPNLLHEHFSRRAVFQKVTSIILIIIGLALLALR